MGLLILERKEFASKYEQIKASAEAAELKQKHDQAVHLLALAEARKREESLKKSLGVEKECLKSVRISSGSSLFFCINYHYHMILIAF